MIRSTPCERYVKFLILHPDGLDDRAIRAEIDRRRLLWCAKQHIDALRARCVPPRGFRPFDEKHKPSQAFLRSMGVRALFFPTKAVAAALTITTLPRAQEALEARVLVGAPDESVAAGVEARTGVKLTARAVRAYRRFFFDTSLVTTSELRALLRRNLRRLGVSDDEARMDARLQASRMPCCKANGLLATIRMGILPRGIEPWPIVREPRVVLAARLVEAATVGGSGAGQEAQQFAQALRVLLDLEREHVPPPDKLMDALSQMRIGHDTRSLPTIHEIAGANFTAELLPRDRDVAPD